MKASEARDLSQKQLESVVSDKLSEVYESIEKAIKKGEFSCYFNSGLKSNVISTLKSNGFNVKDVSDFREPYSTYHITW